ncbi:MAG: hypothetical protein HUU43_11520 [Ignavibacteriaceae bacterium]|nr:hypothetical protein [Ignavibacteriaceae bacterium]
MTKSKMNYFSFILAIPAVGMLSNGMEEGFLMVAVLLLFRQILIQSGRVEKLADERESFIRFRAGDFAFLIMMCGAIVLSLMRLQRGYSPDELYELMMLGFMSRILYLKIAAGNYLAAAKELMSLAFLIMSMLIFFEGGITTISIIGLVVLGIGVALYFAAGKYPLPVAIVLLFAIAALIQFFSLYRLRAVNTTLWIMIITPLLISAITFILSVLEEKEHFKVIRNFTGGLSALFLIVVTLLNLLIPETETRHYEKSVELASSEIQIMNGYPVTGKVFYYDNGKLSSCILARETSVFGNVLPAGTQLSFTFQGELKYVCFPNNTYIRGVLCKGEGPNTWHTQFYPDGNFKLLWSAKDQWIKGVPCREASFWTDVFGGGAGVYFFENGGIQKCKLFMDFEYMGKRYNKGEHLELEKDGKIKI